MIIHSSPQVSWKYVQVGVCAGKQEGVQRVGNYTGIVEVTLLEASVTLYALGDSLDKGFTPLPQPGLPRKDLSLGWLTGPQPATQRQTQSPLPNFVV